MIFFFANPDQGLNTESHPDHERRSAIGWRLAILCHVLGAELHFEPLPDDKIVKTMIRCTTGRFSILVDPDIPTEFLQKLQHKVLGTVTNALPILLQGPHHSRRDGLATGEVVESGPDRHNLPRLLLGIYYHLKLERN